MIFKMSLFFAKYILDLLKATKSKEMQRKLTPDIY
jgi:hypothetical protein